MPVRWRRAAPEPMAAIPVATPAGPAGEVAERIMLAPAALKRLIEPEAVAYLCSPAAPA